MHRSYVDRFGIEYRFFALTPSEHVAAAVAGLEALGDIRAVRSTTGRRVDQTLTGLDDNTDGKLDGVDVVTR